MEVRYGGGAREVDRREWLKGMEKEGEEAKGNRVVDRLRTMAERSRDMSGNTWSEDRE